MRATGRELVAHTLWPDASYSATGREGPVGPPVLGVEGRARRAGRLVLDLPRLEASLQGAALLLLCSPHNPTVRPNAG